MRAHVAFMFCEKRKAQPICRSESVEDVMDKDVSFEQDMEFLSPRNVDVSFEQDMEILSPRNVDVSFEQDMEFLSPRNVDVSFEQDMEILSPRNVDVSFEQDMEILSPRNVDVSFEQDMEFLSPRNVDVSFEQDMEILSPRNVDVSFEQDMEFLSPRNVDVSFEQDMEFLSPRNVEESTMGSKRFRKRHFRFASWHDIILLEEVLRINPFNKYWTGRGSCNLWSQVAQNLRSKNKFHVDSRRCRERTMLLLEHFDKGVDCLKSGSVAEIKLKLKLLEVVKALKE
ncbi:uncharacterized protein LOC111087603 isoform X3 [Limulus polyphemus]|uniref:Uncharacterized protein LOC111087603 isoform X3 n=1 Tax=Limulus polyphemus TaxID=6850 RepID=A0ABM1T3Q8_LIMPO|nr:uncharacterized protein LOC111087603 isoform X3 [Limulus polyphemus]